MNELKPCPFCGGANLYIDGYDHTAGKRWRVVCLDCMAMVDPGTEQQKYRAIEAWNRRADGWIPASKPPEEPGHYLAVVKRTAPEELAGNGTSIRKMRWMGEDWRYATHIPARVGREISDEVTHWMPLPEPPDANP